MNTTTFFGFELYINCVGMTAKIIARLEQGQRRLALERMGHGQARNAGADNRNLHLYLFFQRVAGAGWASRRSTSRSRPLLSGLVMLE